MPKSPLPRQRDKHLGRRHGSSSETPPQVFRGVFFLCTGHRPKSPNICSLIAQHGGVVCRDLADYQRQTREREPVILLSDKFVHTLKYLYALATHILLVDYRWIGHVLNKIPQEGVLRGFSLFPIPDEFLLPRGHTTDIGGREERVSQNAHAGQSLTVPIARASRLLGRDQVSLLGGGHYVNDWKQILAFMGCPKILRVYSPDSTFILVETEQSESARQVISSIQNYRRQRSSSSSSSDNTTTTVRLPQSVVLPDYFVECLTLKELIRRTPANTLPPSTLEAVTSGQQGPPKGVTVLFAGSDHPAMHYSPFALARSRSRSNDPSSLADSSPSAASAASVSSIPAFSMSSSSSDSSSKSRNRVVKRSRGHEWLFPLSTPGSDHLATPTPTSSSQSQSSQSPFDLAMNSSLRQFESFRIILPVMSEDVRRLKRGRTRHRRARRRKRAERRRRRRKVSSRSAGFMMTQPVQRGGSGVGEDDLSTYGRMIEEVDDDDDDRMDIDQKNEESSSDDDDDEEDHESGGRDVEMFDGENELIIDSVEEKELAEDISFSHPTTFHVGDVVRFFLPRPALLSSLDDPTADEKEIVLGVIKSLHDDYRRNPEFDFHQFVTDPEHSEYSNELFLIPHLRSTYISDIIGPATVYNYRCDPNEGYFCLSTLYPTTQALGEIRPVHYWTQPRVTLNRMTWMSSQPAFEVADVQSHFNGATVNGIQLCIGNWIRLRCVIENELRVTKGLIRDFWETHVGSQKMMKLQVAREWPVGSRELELTDTVVDLSLDTIRNVKQLLIVDDPFLPLAVDSDGDAIMASSDEEEEGEGGAHGGGRGGGRGRNLEYLTLVYSAKYPSVCGRFEGV